MLPLRFPNSGIRAKGSPATAKAPYGGQPLAKGDWATHSQWLLSQGAVACGQGGWAARREAARGSPGSQGYSQQGVPLEGSNVRPPARATTAYVGAVVVATVATRAR
ncbi:hypothetical protein BHM03_00036235 [Ensete ventricosum]|nr:hypothetical protein BHM03_00036235 [Ensete ventricosum]